MPQCGNNLTYLGLIIGVYLSLMMKMKEITISINVLKIIYLGSTFYIDLLLFNYNLNCFIVVELKLNKSNYKDINQVLLYKNAVDKLLKREFHNNTIAILVSKKNNKFILEYISDENLFLTTYKINNQI